MWDSYWVMAHTAYPLNYPVTGNHNTCTESFSSSHPGGAYFAYCDGSVHWVDDGISFDLAFNSQSFRKQFKLSRLQKPCRPLRHPLRNNDNRRLSTALLAERCRSN